MRRILPSIIIIILFLFTGPLSAQDPPPDLTGTDFRAWVKTNYYDGEIVPLSYSDARKKMFAYIANDRDSIECVYSGLRQAHPEGWEISFPEPFNTEHIVPQSLFDGNDPMRSDIHILQPAYQDWNSLRSNYEFQELDDDMETELWIYQLQSTENKPSEFIDRYSEYRPFGWEPREVSKGNVARAFMYFFTVYPQYDLTGWIDTSILCRWHEEDEVDSMESARNAGVEFYQGNINPYISFPWWANAAWGCDVEAPVINGFVLLGSDRLSIYPNPSDGRIRLHWYDPSLLPLTAELIGPDGRLSELRKIRQADSEIEVHGAAGMYMLRFRDRDGRALGYRKLLITR